MFHTFHEKKKKNVVRKVLKLAITYMTYLQMVRSGLMRPVSPRNPE
jgi:hypothetical protein